MLCRDADMSAYICLHATKIIVLHKINDNQIIFKLFILNYHIVEWHNQLQKTRLTVVQDLFED